MRIGLPPSYTADLLPLIADLSLRSTGQLVQPVPPGEWAKTETEGSRASGVRARQLEKPRE